MALRAAYLEMHRQTNAHLMKYEVTADQFVCLLILDTHKGITQQELTHLAKSDPNTIRAMLVLLENSGFIERKKHPSDGRAHSVSMTKKGAAIFRKLVKELTPVRDKMLGIFNARELNSLLKSLNRLTSELNNQK